MLVLSNHQHRRSNCYGYALDIDYILTPGTNDEADSDIDDWSTLHGITAGRAHDLLEACKQDGLEELPVSGHKVAVFINEYAACIDYHFYRLDFGGTWSHKLGNLGQPTVVKDPRTANRALVNRADPAGDIIIAQQFCGYLYVPRLFVWNTGDEELTPHSIW